MKVADARYLPRAAPSKISVFGCLSDSPGLGWRAGGCVRDKPSPQPSRLAMGSLVESKKATTVQSERQRACERTSEDRPVESSSRRKPASGWPMFCVGMSSVRSLLSLPVWGGGPYTHPNGTTIMFQHVCSCVCACLCACSSSLMECQDPPQLRMLQPVLISSRSRRCVSGCAEPSLMVLIMMLPVRRDDRSDCLPNA